MRGALVVAVLPLLLCGPLAGFAEADAIDKRGRELDESDNLKVRLSAALALGKSHEARAVTALARALVGDSEASVRGVAAHALGHLVDQDSSAAARDAAAAALERASRSDRNRNVREAARAALAEIAERLQNEDQGGAVGAIFVNVGAATDRSKKLGGHGKEALRAAVKKTLASQAPQFRLGGAAAELPTRSQLKAKRMRGFYVGTAVAEVQVAKRGRRAEVSCKVSVRVSPWSGTDGNESLEAEKSASATGHGVVTTKVGGETIAISDCVLAVGEEVTARQVVPFLRRFESRAEK